ncbi:MAG: M12 family metallopeptidase [Chthoniobacterales bacterium]
MTPNISYLRSRLAGFGFTALLGVPLIGGSIGASTEAGADSKQWSIATYDRLLAGTRGENELVNLGDMVFRASSLRSFRASLSGAAGVRTDAATPHAFKRWPKGRVPYVFDGAVSTDHQRDFRQAARDWNTFAHVRFLERTTESDYLIVQDATASSESFAVGEIGGAQPFNVASWRRYDLLHGMGHALGLIHEHQRSDRDQFVIINKDNIQPGAEGNFVLIPGSVNLGQYDFLSVMHYRRNEESIAPDLDTIRPKNPYHAFLNVYGQQQPRPLSRGDRDGMASLYGVGRESGPVVVNGRGAGPGSLQAALYYAFDHPGTTIRFDIPVSDQSFDGTVFRIKPRDSLFVSGPHTIIDGSTQPRDPQNEHAGPEVVLDGENALAAGVNGIDLTETSCQVRDLAVVNFSGDGVRIHGANATGNLLAGCSIGAGPFSNSEGNAGVGVHIFDHASDNTIGGSHPGEGNGIADSGEEGILISGAGISGTVIKGNEVGILSQRSARGNSLAGIALRGGVSQTVIGGEEPGARNAVSGNGGDGITLDGGGTIYNEILGNLIGEGDPPTFSVGNRGAGVALTGGAHLNAIGRPGAGNTIGFNNGAGVSVSGAKTTGNLLSGNNILRNGNLGIDLAGGSESSGVTANDTGDPDTGPNKLQNYPELTGADITDNGITISGTLNTLPNEPIRLEFFSSVFFDPTLFGEGERFLGFADVMTDGQGNVNFSVDLPAMVGHCSHITATATSGAEPTGAPNDPGLNTSEFSRRKLALPCE